MKTTILHKGIELDGHELISYFFDVQTGLEGFFSLHNTNLGPAVGGTRCLPYRSAEEALRDALLLSRAMTYKCALAGVPFGGGKAVIIGSFNGKNRLQKLTRYGERLNLFKGSFFTGEDVGISMSDVEVLAKKSSFIIGSSHASGDPSPWAARGVLHAMKAALQSVFGSKSMAGRKIAIKGLGKVGQELCQLVSEEGAEIIVTDINPVAIKKIHKLFSRVVIVPPTEIHRQKVDVFSPCALGGDLNRASIKKLRCAIVCGSANNQLAMNSDGDRLHKAGILYIPDYLANAGGLINVVDELNPTGYNRNRVIKKVSDIELTTLKLLEYARKKRQATHVVADAMAQSIFSKKVSHS
ncbi:MAG: amino acid dehydrogenase [Candidatus Sungbacteria bacterium]|nr:amino acid dehydrogenase [bacterium]MDZ4299648.1 amino acid dehydrogenase [Candidatus Sungbacteria bacterium]